MAHFFHLALAIETRAANFDGSGGQRTLLFRDERGFALGPSAAGCRRAIEEHARIALSRLVGLGAKAPHRIRIGA